MSHFIRTFTRTNPVRLTQVPRQFANSAFNKTARTFSSTPFTMVQAGDAIPSVDLNEGTPGDNVNLSKDLASGQGLIIGVPAAFSPSCSETHVPGYIASAKTKSFGGPVYVVSVNDAFVMKAWGKNLDPDGKSGIRFLADPRGEFTKALGLDFDASGMLGNSRSVRYALVTEGGKIKSVHEEPDKIGVDVSSVEKVLG